MKAKCFQVEVIKYKDANGNDRTLYKVWFNLTSGIGWLMTSKPITAGQDVDLEIVALSTQDVKTNMRLALRIVG